jgi:hypothetical protein
MNIWRVPPRLLLVLLTLSLFCVLPALEAEAQTPSADTSRVTDATPRSSKGTQTPRAWDEVAEKNDPGYLTRSELILSTEVLLFGFTVLIFQFLLLRRKPATQAGIIRALGLTLILVGTLFALTAGFGSEQIAPAMGLFGTVAGYLLGRQPQRSKEKEGPR